jgi:hypothetical protein
LSTIANRESIIGIDDRGIDNRKSGIGNRPQLPVVDADCRLSMPIADER